MTKLRKNTAANTVDNHLDTYKAMYQDEMFESFEAEAFDREWKRVQETKKPIAIVKPAKVKNVAVGRRHGNQAEYERFCQENPLPHRSYMAGSKEEKENKIATINRAIQWLARRSTPGTDSAFENELICRVLKGEISASRANEIFNSPVKKYPIFVKGGQLNSWWRKSLPQIANLFG